jgi:hypothetical protein
MKGRDKRPWGDRVLDQREAAAGLLAPNHEPDADPGELDVVAVVRADLARSLRGVEAGELSGFHRAIPFR